MTPVLAYGLALISVILYGTLPVILKKSSLGSIPPFSFISTTMFVLFCLSGVAAYFFEKKAPLTGFSETQWKLIALFGLVNFVGFALFALCLEKVPVPHYQFMSIISILVGIILSYFFLDTPIKPSFFLGGALVTAGLYIALFR